MLSSAAPYSNTAAAGGGREGGGGGGGGRRRGEEEEEGGGGGGGGAFVGYRYTQNSIANMKQQQLGSQEVLNPKEGHSALVTACQPSY